MFVFSPSKKCFYALGMRPDYEAAGTWPDDGQESSEAEFIRVSAALNEGKVVSGFSDGLVQLSDPAPPTPEIIQSQRVGLVQRHLDDAAKALNYDSIANAITYAEEPAVPKFQAEGLAFRAWRSLVWAACYAVLDDVMNGLREIPTDEELISELPALVLPE